MDSVLRVRGVKDVDLRAAGLKVGFELEAAPAATTGCSVPAPRSGSEGGGDGSSRDNGIGLGEAARGGTGDSGGKADMYSGNAPAVVAASRQLQLSVGCCIYQKGKYLLGHLESCDDSSAARLPPAVLSRTPPRSPLLSLFRTDTDEGKAGSDRGAAFSGLTQPVPRFDGSTGLSPADRKRRSTPHDTSTPLLWPEGSPRRARETGVQDTEELHRWGGGPGPRPCEEALTVVRSLRVPLSDPHYFRVADVSLSLLEEDGGTLVRRAPMLGGGEGADDGWESEVLVTRCAVVGNPRQPRTRADAMLSRIRVEVRTG